VTLLRLCASAFRRRFAEFNVDPLLETFTTASLCSLVYRRNFYQKNSIGLIPSTGYRGRQSREGLKFLLWREIVEGHQIESAARNKERIILGRPVDGYFEAENGDRWVYEYLGKYHKQKINKIIISIKYNIIIL